MSSCEMEEKERKERGKVEGLALVLLGWRRRPTLHVRKNNRVTKKVLMNATKKKFIFLPFQLKVKLMVISSDMCLDT